MTSLFWSNAKGKTRVVPASTFESEQAFEESVFETPELLEEIFLLKRQVRGGTKSGIPDIIGIDEDGKVCIIEMKNERVDAGVIPQVLKYAIWAESQPDSIKSLWYEADDLPEDLEVDWDNLEVRILVIAPSIDRSTLQHVNKIDYQVDLIEINRWRIGKDSWLLVNRLETEIVRRIRPTSGLKSYDEKAYQRFHKPDAVKRFLAACKELHALARTRKWPVQPNYKKNYCSFKIGNANCFGVKWMGTRSFGFFVIAPSEKLMHIQIAGFEKRSKGNRATFIPKSDRASVGKLRKVMELALKDKLV